jgi:hypothetical protein
LLLAPAAGAYLWLQVRRAWVRHEVKVTLMAGLEKEDLVLFKISQKTQPEDFVWKHKTEFACGNQLYDVVIQEEHGDTLYLWCFWDEKESIIHQRLDRLAESAQQNDPLQHSKHKQLISFFKTLFCHPQAEAVPYRLANTTQNEFRYPDRNTRKGYPPPAPPPQIG